MKKFPGLFDFVRAAAELISESFFFVYRHPSARGNNEHVMLAVIASVDEAEKNIIEFVWWKLDIFCSILIEPGYSHYAHFLCC